MRHTLLQIASAFLLQNAAILLQNATVITEYDVYYKMRHYTPFKFELIDWNIASWNRNQFP